MTELRWVLFRGNERVLQWRDSDGHWNNVREINHQEARQEDRIAQEDKADADREAAAFWKEK